MPHCGKAQTASARSVPVVGAPIEIATPPRTNPDDAIAVEINRAFYYDPRISSAWTRVDVVNGVVTLTGAVPTDQARVAADQIASRIPGVTKVIDRLEVAPLGPEHSDEEIYRNIRHAFGTDPQVNRYRMNVGVINGRVFLAGNVDTVAARAKAANLAAEVPGVISVENALDVPQTHHLYNDWTAGGIYPDKTHPPGDDQLRHDIAERLHSSALVDPNRINVYVRDRIATLTGLVANDTERNAAVHNAYAAGAKLVNDELTLRPPEPLAEAPATTANP